MNIIKVDPENMRASQYGVEKAVEIILRGGIVVAPSDTVYSIVADATNERAVKMVFKMKKRPDTNPVSVIVRDLEMTKKLAFVDSRIEKILGAVWPGAITVVLQKKYNLPELVTAGKRTIALRFPDYKLLYYLISAVGRPLTATSATILGEKAMINAERVASQFRKEFFRPDLILDAGELKFCEPSTVLDLSGEKPKFIRISSVNPKKLMEILSI
ncbi:MAG: L-threonylcarbamoyladenylate synthase [bacterium]